jgi:hypothetical protein
MTIQNRTKRHKWIDILTIALCAVICGADSWVAKESHLSQVGRTFTCIYLRVQPFLFLDLVGEVIYGLITVIHSHRIARPLPFLSRENITHNLQLTTHHSALIYVAKNFSN